VGNGSKVGEKEREIPVVVRICLRKQTSKRGKKLGTPKEKWALRKAGVRDWKKKRSGKDASGSENTTCRKGGDSLSHAGKTKRTKKKG